MENPHSVLKKVFGYDSFRPGQEEIVRSLLAELLGNPVWVIFVVVLTIGIAVGYLNRVLGKLPTVIVFPIVIIYGEEGEDWND